MALHFGIEVINAPNQIKRLRKCTSIKHYMAVFSSFAYHTTIFSIGLIPNEPWNEIVLVENVGKWDSLRGFSNIVGSAQCENKEEMKYETLCFHIWMKRCLIRHWVVISSHSLRQLSILACQFRKVIQTQDKSVIWKKGPDHLESQWLLSHSIR